MSQIKALRTLVGVRKRAGDKLEVALSEHRAGLGDLEARVAEADTSRIRCVQAEQDARDARANLLGGACTPGEVKLRDLLIDDAKANVAAAEQVLKKARVEVERQQLAIDKLLDEQRRNQQRMERFEEHIAQLRRAGEAAADEVAEEETEETAAARFSRRQREGRETPAP